MHQEMHPAIVMFWERHQGDAFPASVSWKGIVSMLFQWKCIKGCLSIGKASRNTFFDAFFDAFRGCLSGIPFLIPF
jgi:hypothetical protein